MSISRLAICSGGREAWDIGLAQYNPPDGLSWNLATANQVSTFSVSTQDSTPQDLFFKPDGTKMYMLGGDGRDVNEYNLSSPWVTTTATYSQRFSISTQDLSPRGLFFKPDGLKMYVLGQIGDAVYEYNLSVSWDVSTAVYSQLFSVATEDTTPTGISFKPDGLKMYVLGGSDFIYEYNLSTAWNITTATYSQSFSVVAQDAGTQSLFFKPDGTKMYVVGSVGDAVYEYNLSAAWNITTATYSQSFSVATQETSPSGLFFEPSGGRMYVLGISSNFVIQYVLGGFSIAAQEAGPSGLFFKPDGLKMYIIGITGDEVNEYNLSSPWDMSTAVFSQLYSVAAQEQTPEDLFFKPDGTKMYVVGTTGDDVNEYALLVAWDISTAIYSQNFSVAAQETTPTGLFFKPDGLKMYVAGATGQDVNEYNLSTAWNITTATYSQSFSVAAQEPSPKSLFFRSNGTKMYVVGGDINEYNLSTAWDISTAIYSQNFFSVQGSLDGFFFKPDGRGFYIVASTTDKIYQYRIG